MNARARLSRLAAVVALAAGIGVVHAGTAFAHDVLISSDPKDGSTVATAPSSVTFTFDQPVQHFDPVVSLVGPDGRQFATGTPVISGNVVTGAVQQGPAGAYVAAYRIVSADGHPVTGEIHFTVTRGSVVSPGSRAAGSAAPASPTGRASGSAGLSGGLWAGLIVAALCIAAAAVILFHRPSSKPSGDQDY